MAYNQRRFVFKGGIYCFGSNAEEDVVEITMI